MRSKISISLFVCFSFTCLSSISAQMVWNQACSFSGSSSSYVAVPNSSSLNITGDFTIETWINPVNTLSPSAQIILQKRAGASNGYTLYLSSGRVTIRTNSSTRLIGKTVIPNNQWTHIAGSYTASSGLFRVFVNGLQDTSVIIASAAPVSNSDSLLLGVGSNSPFSGMLDEVRVWNTDLSSAFIPQIMRMTLGTNSGYYSGLVMSLTFQTANPGTFFSLNDFCGNNNNGFNRGVTAFSMNNNPSNYISVNECVTLDGTGDYIAGSDNSAVSPVSGISLEAWIYPRSFNASTSVYSSIIHKGNSSGSITDYRVEIQKRAFRLLINETNIFNLTTTNEYFPLNQWTHFAVTYSGSDGFIKFIKNGDIAWDDTTFVGNIHDNTDSLYIGGTPSLQCFDGYVDEVKINSASLSYENISNQMFTSVNEMNDPSGTNVVFNLDGGLLSNTDSGLRLHLRGNSRFSQNSYFNNIPVSPLSFSSSLNFPNGFYLSGAGERIPLSGTSGFMTSDTIDVPLNETITDVNVFAGLNHTDEDNLILSLISPAGTAVTLYSTSALIGANDNIVTIFNDQADSIQGSNKYVMYTPVIRPINNLNSVFSGTNTKGKWKLRIQDASASDTGKLFGWGIQFNNQSQRKKVLSLTSLIEGFYNPSTNLMIRDTVKVSVRSNISPYSVYETVAAKLNDSGKADFAFSSVPDGVPVFLQITHRNSIETWSRKPSSGFFNILFSTHFQAFTSFLKFDFSLSPGTAFGSNQKHVDTSPNKYAIYGGDINQDGTIDASDVSSVDNDAYNSLSGYVNTDVTGDDFVDAQDVSIVDNNAFNSVSVITP